MLAREGGKLLVEVIPLWVGDAMNAGGPHEGYPDTLAAEPQNHSQATFTSKIKKEDGLIDFSEDAYRNYLKFCAYDEWPGTYFFTEKDGKKTRVKITEAQYTCGAFTPVRVIPEGKREIDYRDFLRRIQ